MIRGLNGFNFWNFGILGAVVTGADFVHGGRSRCCRNFDGQATLVAIPGPSYLPSPN